MKDLPVISGKRKKAACVKRQGRKRPGDETDTSVALDLRMNHKLTYEEIGKILGKKKQTIHSQIKHLIPTVQTDDFKNNRADILAHTQLRLLQNLTPTKLNKASAKDTCVSFGILYDKERLERGQATSITDVRSLILELDAAEAKALAMCNHKDMGVVLGVSQDKPGGEGE